MANLWGTNLENTNLFQANLMGASLFKTNLTKSNLSKANLFKSIFFEVKLTNTNLSGADILGITFEKIDMSNSNLSQADLTGSNLSGVDLSGTNLSGCKLTGTKFHLCLLAETNIEGAYLSRTVFADCDLRGLIGFKNVIHNGPSTIGIDTILRSEGDIPSEFLRGCGLPDRVIDSVKSLAKTIQYYTCFVSYSSKDESFVEYLKSKLREADVQCWYYKEDNLTGEKTWEDIERNIYRYDKVVVICSRNGLESPAVIREIEFALKREQEEDVRRLKDHDRVDKGDLNLQDIKKRRYRKRILFPIMIDDYLLKHWKHHLQTQLSERNAVDFRCWEDPDNFQKAFNKLLKDLNRREES